MAAGAGRSQFGRWPRNWLTPPDNEGNGTPAFAPVASRKRSRSTLQPLLAIGTVEEGDKTEDDRREQKARCSCGTSLHPESVCRGFKGEDHSSVPELGVGFEAFTLRVVFLKAL